MPKTWSSEFAQKQLEKHGWTEGAGLGRTEDGIKEAIKVHIKHDKTGVGHDAAAEFTYHWWDHVFNKAAKSIEINNTQEGVSVKKTSDAGPVSSKKPVKGIDKKTLLYGNFIKAATLTNEGNEISEPKDDSDDTDSDDEQLTASLSKFSDEDLVKQCGGRTAHKAARHGFGLSAKLRRIEEQEQMVQSSGNNSQSTSESEHKSKKREKKSKKMEEEDVVEKDTDILNGCSAKKKKSKKSKRENIACENEDTSPVEIEVVKKKSKKSKSKKKDCGSDGERTVTKCEENDLNHQNGVLTQDIEMNGTVEKKKKKSKRKNDTSEDNELPTVKKVKLEEDENCDKLRKKKKKSKKSAK